MSVVGVPGLADGHGGWQTPFDKVVGHLGTPWLTRPRLLDPGPRGASAAGDIDRRDTDLNQPADDVGRQPETHLLDDDGPLECRHDCGDLWQQITKGRVPIWFECLVDGIQMKDQPVGRKLLNEPATVIRRHAMIELNRAQVRQQ
jgi:hypothetical protein